MKVLSDSFIGEDSGSQTTFPGDLKMLLESPKFLGLRAGFSMISTSSPIFNITSWVFPDPQNQKLEGGPAICF